MSESIMMQPGLADVVDRFDDSIRQRLSSQGHQVLNHIQACRTSLLGGRLLHCNECQKHYVQYHSCRDRHCPLCGYQASQHWVDARMKDVLPVTYHHLVFTLPHELNPWVTRYRSVIYRLERPGFLRQLVKPHSQSGVAFCSLNFDVIAVCYKKSL